jgi:NhaA family Na+:H+ antiporter
VTDDRPHPRLWQTTVPRLSHFAVEHLLLLPLGVAIALIWANVGPDSYFRFRDAAAFATNDVAMVLFFGLMTKEVVEATAPGGVLHRWHRLLVPVFAAVGAAAVPALIHAYLVEPLDEPVLRQAWPVTLATDIALAYLAVRLIFGKSHAAIPFAILLAIAGDILGFLAVAAFSPTRETRWIEGLGILVLAMALAALMRRRRIRSFWPYFLGPGSLAWWALYWSGVHPALALVPIVPFLPHAARDPGFFADADAHAPDALSRFEVFWRYPAQAALFFFGLVNAGITSGSLEEGTWALPIGMLLGKPVGVLLGAGLATLAGLHLPHRIGWRELIVIGLSAAVGLSVGLFFTEALIAPGQLRSEVSMGVMLTTVGLPAAVVVAKLLGVGRYRHAASTVASEVK